MLKTILEFVIGWPWCWHRWKTEKSKTLVDGDDAVGLVVYLRCEKCGDWKRRRLA